MFELDPRLANDGPQLANLCPTHLVIVKTNGIYPWLVVVPRVAAVSELFDLTPQQRHDLIDLTARLSQALKEVTGADKINVDVIGNVCSQLHLHIIARKKDDPLWPNPIWREPAPTGDWLGGDVDAFAARLRTALQTT